eukprot:6478036-Amphidinium_carterae.1
MIIVASVLFTLRQTEQLPGHCGWGMCCWRTQWGKNAKILCHPRILQPGNGNWGEAVGNNLMGGGNGS